MAKNKVLTKTLFIAGTVLCCIFALILVCNLTIIIKGVVNPKVPPSVFGVTPMVVQSGSMSGNAEDHIEVGDLIFTVKPDTDKLKAGDIISYMDGNIAVTHRIIEVQTAADGKRSFVTKGDANNTEDPAVGEDAVLRVVFRGWVTLPCSCKDRWVWRCLSAYRCVLLSSTTLSAAREAPAERIRKPRS